jgi:hypothetical protein
MSVQKNLCQFVLYLVGNCVNLCQFGKGFLLVFAPHQKSVLNHSSNEEGPTSFKKGDMVFHALVTGFQTLELLLPLCSCNWNHINYGVHRPFGWDWKKCFLWKKVLCLKIKTIHVCHCIFLTMSRNAMRKSAPRVECVFEHILKMSPRSGKSYIHNCVIRCPLRPPHWHL